MDNIIIADFSKSRDVIASGRYQYDYGQIYKPVGVELPDNFEVHFGNEFVNESYTVLGNADGALVPDVLFTTGLNILAWIFLHDGTDDGRTVYRAYIPIARRSAVTDTPPTPEEQSAITQAIALMQEYLEQMPTKTSDLENDGDGTSGSTFPTTAQMNDAIDAKVVGALKPKGSCAFANLPALSAANVNTFYNVSDSFTTTADFIEGAGHAYPAGTNVAIINTGSDASPVYKYDAMTGEIDLSDYWNTTNLTALTTAEVDEVWDSVFNPTP